jgi:hypothetical protein
VPDYLAKHGPQYQCALSMWQVANRRIPAICDLPHDSGQLPVAANSLFDASNDLRGASHFEKHSLLRSLGAATFFRLHARACHFAP